MPAPPEQFDAIAGTGSIMHKRLLCTPLFSVEHREFERSGHRPVILQVVVHPGAVVILPILADGRIVMIRNYRYTVERELWELPAGTLEPGETPLETGRRELEEETGYRAGVMTPLLEFYTSPGVLTERMHAFLATELTPVGQKLQDSERIQVELMEGEVVQGMLLRGDFMDGKTIAVLGLNFLRRAAETRNA